MSPFVSPLSAVGRDDLARVGGKGANLGELIRAGFRVPPGFSVRSESHGLFLDTADLRTEVEKVAATIDYDVLEGVQEKTGLIREMICSSPIPDPVAREIAAACELLQEGGGPLVAVRSSVAAGDLARTSFPGQMDTFHNLRGTHEVLTAVRECWASVWSARAAGILHTLGTDPHRIIIAPIVQAMVQSEIAGVLFTAHPVTGDAGEMLVEAAYGLGEAVVSGSLTPDRYVIAKRDLEVVTSSAGRKAFKLDLDLEQGRGTRKVPLSEEQARRACLAPDQVRELAALGVAVERHFGGPQDLEWAFSGGTLFVLQTRRIPVSRRRT